jgi:hypothetical protein
MKRITYALLVSFFFIPVLNCASRQPQLPPITHKADLSKYSTVFIQWIDFNEDYYAVLGYGTKAEWTNDIEVLNDYFQQFSKMTLFNNKERVILGKDVNDKQYPPEGLLLKLSDIRIDYDNYHLYAAIDLVDLETKKTILSTPCEPYYGDAWGFVRYLKAALKVIVLRVQENVIM